MDKDDDDDIDYENRLGVHSVWVSLLDAQLNINFIGAQ